MDGGHFLFFSRMTIHLIARTSISVSCKQTDKTMTLAVEIANRAQS